VPNILYITNLPTPYRLPLYRRLGEVLRGRGDALNLFFLGYAKSDRRWEVGDDDLRGIVYETADRGSASAMRDVIRAVDRHAPAVVVLAWAMDQVALRLLLHCRRRGIPCLVVSGETPHSAANNPYRLLRWGFRVPFFKLASFLTYGSASADYLLAMGVPAGRITTGINAVDTAYFAAQVDALRASGAADAERLRHRNGDGRPFAAHLLFVGYLLPEKGVLHAIAMMAELGREDVALHIVGAGPQEEALRLEAARRGLGDRVIFHGYRQQWELPIAYTSADALIFPSTLEVFGLVMVEALAAGLPIIASALAGGTPDVVEHGVNGFVVDPADTAAMARAARALVDDGELRRRMGEASRVASDRFGIDASVARYMVAIERLLDRAGIQQQG
jgi:glycosyltransferase involved in cell wall biosynthesis